MEQAENRNDQHCGHCGTALTGETTGGLCPRCLLEMNFASRTMPGGEPSPQVPPPSPEEIAARFPQFEILECLGRGGMGIVYKARQKTLDRLVAIKLLAGERRDDPQFEARFSREARTLAKLSHPNIVTVHDFGESDGMFYLVMEFVDGVNLRDVLRDGHMEPAQALAIVPSICEALQFAHDHGVIHRDIKPENILMDRDGRVKIADFGIATLVGAAAERSGTPPYMAPEQEAADESVDHRADIYALGVVFYEMLTGERPARDPSRPSQRIEVDVRLDEIVLRALEKRPEQRYQTAGEFRTVVQTIAGPANGEEGMPESGRSRPSPRVEYDPWEVFSIVIGTGIFVGMLAFCLEWSSPFRVPLMVICALGLGICVLSFAGYWPVRSPLYPDPNFSSRNTRRCRVLVEGPSAATRTGRWLWFTLSGLAALAVVSTVVVFWLQRPRQVDGRTISADSPDGMFRAMGQTWHSMRVLDGDRSFYRFRVQGRAGSVFEKWEVDVPYDKLATSYVLLSLDEVKFGEHGSIVWSEDGERVSFRVNGTEVSAFNTVDGGHSFEDGYHLQRDVSPKTSKASPAPPPQSDREVVEGYARALADGDFGELEQIWELEDDLDRRFARKLAALCARADEMTVELVSMRRLDGDSLFACFLTSNGPEGFAPVPAPLMTFFHAADGRWRCAPPHHFRTMHTARTMGVERMGRRVVVQRILAARFQPENLERTRGIVRAQAEAFERLAGHPHNLEQFEAVAKQVKESIVELDGIKSWEDLVAKTLGDLGDEWQIQDGDFHFLGYLETGPDDSEDGDRSTSPLAEGPSFAEGVERFPLEPFPCLTDEQVRQAELRQAVNGDAVQIDLTLTRFGTEIMGQVTGESVGKRLAIVIGGEVVSAPVIRMPINGGKLTITGSFSAEEAQTIVDQLNAHRKAAEEVIEEMDRELGAATAPTPPAEAADPPEHEAVAVVRRFLHAVATGDHDAAVRLGVDGEFRRDGLIKFGEAYQLDRAELRDAYAGISRAAVLTKQMPTRGSARSGSFGYSLVRTGDHWLVRDSDFLPDEPAVERWLADFRRGEPAAERVAGNN